MPRYAQVSDVTLIGSTKAESFNMTQENYEKMVEKVLTWVEAEMDTYMNHAYTDEELSTNPALQGTLESVAVQAVDNFLLSQAQRVTAPVITVNEFTVRQPKREFLTPELKATLAPYRYARLNLGAV